MCANFRLARLTELDLSQNRKNGAWVLEELASGAEYVGNVLNVTLSGNPAVADKTVSSLADGYFRALQMLRLDSCGNFSDDAAAKLPGAQNCAALKLLDLRAT